MSPTIVLPATEGYLSDMNNGANSRKRPSKVVEYVIEDFLELRGCLDTKEMKQAKSVLLSQKACGDNVTSVEGFHLGRQLVLIVRRAPTYFEHLICVCPKEGKIRIRKLRGGRRSLKTIRKQKS